MATPDILWRNENGSVGIWDMSGTAILQADITVDLGPIWYIEATGDFCDDDKIDTAFAERKRSGHDWEDEPHDDSRVRNSGSSPQLQKRGGLRWSDQRGADNKARNAG
jgi:hypothetical protein